MFVQGFYNRVYHNLSSQNPVLLLPFEVNSGDIENDAFQPEDHKEALREGAVSDALSITPSLHTQTYLQDLQDHPVCCYMAILVAFYSHM